KLLESRGRRGQRHLAVAAAQTRRQRLPARIESDADSVAFVADGRGETVGEVIHVSLVDRGSWIVFFDSRSTIHEILYQPSVCRNPPWGRTRGCQPRCSWALAVLKRVERPIRATT